ncbi:uncharacterized protein DC041_0011563 [Schistosoma bovis]|uniref:Uncharacterized protein n=1 Tax=Schistosoma bovis TaxID=6184 RepID=A0A430QG78_SCHBO|nr:uncharacterized protein DC041_0011563 [Schistosoma bovis]
MCELGKKEIRYTIMSYNLRYQEIGRSKMKSSFRFFFYKMKTSKSMFVVFLRLKYKMLVMKRLIKGIFRQTKV